ncbi:MAG: chemotaxis protein CheD [Burkholderiales bacterium]|nr:chemotaxis protein CheD [Burkholderiales bacterium]
MSPKGSHDKGSHDITRPVSSGVTVLHPGDVACGERGERFETLLGSCVAIVLTDPRRTLGAMCHVVHSSPAPAAHQDDSAWGDAALRKVYSLLQGRGIDPRQCEAWVYGGGNMFPERFSGPHVGQYNAQWALDTLQSEGIRVIDADLGGAHYRKLAWSVGAQPPQVVCVPV